MILIRDINNMSLFSLAAILVFSFEKWTCIAYIHVCPLLKREYDSGAPGLKKKLDG